MGWHALHFASVHLFPLYTKPRIHPLKPRKLNPILHLRCTNPLSSAGYGITSTCIIIQNGREQISLLPIIKPGFSSVYEPSSPPRFPIYLQYLAPIMERVPIVERKSGRCFTPFLAENEILVVGSPTHTSVALSCSKATENRAHSTHNTWRLATARWAQMR